MENESTNERKKEEKLRTRALKRVTCLQNKVVHLPLGVVLFKNCLNMDQQMALLRTCMQMTKYGGNESVWQKKKRETESSRSAIPLLFYNWPKFPESFKVPRPKDLLSFGEKVFKEALASTKKSVQVSRLYNSVLNSHLQKYEDDRFNCPEQFTPNALYAILYPKNGRFGAHLDGAKGWVLSVSIGDTAKFFWSATYDGEKHSILVESGDVVLFNGGLIYHGVEEIQHGTAPPFWTSSDNEMSAYGMSRFNLQFRDGVRDRLTYDPQFPEEGSRDDGKIEKYIGK